MAPLGASFKVLVKQAEAGGQIAGVASDVVSAMTAAADTWEELTISFTPTAAGVVEIEAQAYGGTTESVYVDDMSFT